MAITERAIVLGVGRSADAEAALRWALHEAAIRKAPVHLVRAYSSPLPYGWPVMGADMLDAHYRFVQRSADKLFTTKVVAAARIAPEVLVTGATIEGNTSRTLVDASANSALVVLGSRGVEGVGSVLLGSVGIAVAARASCPVVVVPAPSRPVGVRASVVVGVDGTDDTDAALEFGFEHANRHRAPLRAVLCWDPDDLVSLRCRPRQPTRTRAAAWLDAAISRWRDKYPDVRARGELVPGEPVNGLVNASAGQHLLVVRNRRRRALAGTLIGSVAGGVLHQAECPVAVIPEAST